MCRNQSDGIGQLPALRVWFVADWPIEVQVVNVDNDLKVVVEYLEGLVGATGGEMWEVDDSVLLLLPCGGPADWSRFDAPDGGADPAGDREPRVSVVRSLSLLSIESRTTMAPGRASHGEACHGRVQQGGAVTQSQRFAITDRGLSAHPFQGAYSAPIKSRIAATGGVIGRLQNR